MQHQQLTPMLKDNQKNNSIASTRQKRIMLQSLGELHHVKGQHDKALSMFLHMPILLHHNNNEITKRKSSPSSGCKCYFNCIDIENDVMHRANENYRINNISNNTGEKSCINGTHFPREHISFQWSIFCHMQPT